MDRLTSNLSKLHWPMYTTKRVLRGRDLPYTNDIGRWDKDHRIRHINWSILLGKRSKII